jgi:hypothetical protein
VTDAGGAEPTARPGFGPALEILALWALAGAQPALELFGKNAEFFVASHTGAGEIVAFAALVAFGVPLVLIAVELLAGLVRRSWVAPLHRVVVALLGGLLGLNVARQLGLDAWVTALPVAAAFGALALWVRSRAMGRTALHYLAIAPLAFFLLFVFTSDANSLIFSDEADVVDLEAGSGGPVAVVVLDELPLASLLTIEGEINDKRFPNLAELGDMSTWYRNVTAVNPSTPESVPSILTGRYPEEGVLPTSADRPINIFTLLGGSYRVSAFEGVTDLCPDAVCRPTHEDGGFAAFVDDVTAALEDASVVYGHLTLPQPLRDDLPSLGQAWAGFLDQPEGADDPPSPEDLAATEAADDRDAITDFLSGRASAARSRGGQGRDLVPLIKSFNARRGSLLVGHDPFLPHRPWHITPSGAAYDPAVGGVVAGEERWPDSPAFVRRVLQRHLLQVGFADNLVGQLLERFRRAGTLDEATIVVVADHGMAFELGGPARNPTDSTVHEIYRVPLLIKAPGQGPGEGTVSDQRALLVDVLPTVLDLLDIDPPDNADFDGQSLVDPDFHREGDRPVFYGNGPQSVPGDFGDVLPAVLRNAAYVGDGGWNDLLRVGPAGHFVGRQVDEVDRSRPVDGEWSIDQEELADIPDYRSRPITVSGRVTLDDEDEPLPNQVLIALDGVLAGIGDLDRDTGHFAALMDERRLTNGPHEIELFLPTEDDTLRRIVGG